jgi:hypothetical protein
MVRNIDIINKIMGLLAIGVSLAISIPLSIKVQLEGGGTWGFGIIGLPILLSLSAYILFGLTALIKSDRHQRTAFIITHFVSFGTSAIVMFLFPVYPTLLVSIPLVLAVFGLIMYTRYKYYLLAMLLFTLVENIVLLKWELDFHRTVPIIQLVDLFGSKV